MARNYEKNFGQLNRLWLSREDTSNKRPRRPRLADLNTVEDIRKWIPSIKEDIDFCLTQSQVPCYTDRKVKEYHKKVLKLEIEYKRFLKKAKNLDSSAVISTDALRPYERKRKDEKCNIPIRKNIQLPVLEQPENQIEIQHENQLTVSFFQNSDLPLQIEPKPTSVCYKERLIKQSQPKPNALGLCYSSSDDET